MIKIVAEGKIDLKAEGDWLKKSPEVQRWPYGYCVGKATPLGVVGRKVRERKMLSFSPRPCWNATCLRARTWEFWCCVCEALGMGSGHPITCLHYGSVEAMQRKTRRQRHYS